MFISARFGLQAMKSIRLCNMRLTARSSVKITRNCPAQAIYGARLKARKRRPTTGQNRPILRSRPFSPDSACSPQIVHHPFAARALGIFGDSVTTDHISPAGAISESAPAGRWLKENGVQKADFNSYGARRGNHEVMMRGTFANVRIKNLMVPPKPEGARVEGGITIHQPSGEQMFIYDAAMRYLQEGVSNLVFAGEEYGTGSSRDWAAKGTQLLGVKAVIARSFERIHRSNLVGMGVLPLQFTTEHSAQTLGLTGEESFDLDGLDAELKPQQQVTLTIHRVDGASVKVPLLLRIDTPIEID